MPFDIFSPPVGLSPSSSRSVKPRINTAQFGDGYGQRSEDGLNAAARTYSAQWQTIDADVADTIEAFLDAHRSTPFYWTPPLESVERKWIASEWSRSMVEIDIVNLSVSLTEVFDL